MTEKSFWQKILIAFNPNFYHQVVFQPLRQGLKFLALFFLLLSLVLSLKYSFDFYKFSQKLLKGAPTFFEKLKGFPEIRIEKGELVFPKEKFIQKWPDFSLIIDSQGEVKDYLKAEKGLVLVKKKAIWKTAEKMEIYDLSKIDYFDFTLEPEKNFPIFRWNGNVLELEPKRIKSWADIFVFFLSPFFFLFVFFSLWIGKGIQILIFSLFSLVINKIKKLKFSYLNLLNIGIFALLPSLIFESLIKVSGVSVPYFGLIYYLLYFGFLVAGLLKSGKVSTLKINA